MLAVTYLSFPGTLGLTLGLTLAGLAISFAVMLVAGGFKAGRLKRRLEMSVPLPQWEAFLVRMNHRLSELGFLADSPTGPFRQGKYSVGSSIVQTHAKTTKVIELTRDDSDPRTVKLALLLRFEEFILGDSGETAYADAVLKYVTNESDSMQVVPNTSAMAICSIVLALWQWVVMFGLKALGVEPFMPTMVAMNLTSVTIALLAIVSVFLKPAELRGLWLGFLGILVSLGCFGASLLLAIRS